MFSPDSPKLVDRFNKFYREYYESDIAKLAQEYPTDNRSLWIDWNHLYQFDPDFADDFRDRPRLMIECAERSLQDHDVPVDVSLNRVNVRVYNLPRTHHPSDLHAEDVDTYVAVSGQLTRVTDVNPRIKVGAWDCQRCGTMNRIPQGRRRRNDPYECQGCERKGPFQIDTEQSEFVDQRKIKLEEPIEERSQAEGVSVPVYVEDDLVDYGPGSTQLPDHAGEMATVEGIARIDESKFNSKNKETVESSIWLDAKAITFDTDVAEDIAIDEHKAEFTDLARRDDAVDLVAESLAPSLHAEEGDDLYAARRACAAWLFNGYRLDPEGGESKRGDMHMALIGDPSTGKSTLMSYAHEVLPKSEYRTGPGLSKVGLTAAAVQEEFAGKTEWTLQPGILPRADGGHCLIDEVDAIVDEDTKAIHDALEGEQVVKADKAGIQADLPSRCAVLVGGNPTYTRFDPYEPVTEQIDLDPALFDRMDLVFALQDEVDEERDRTKAEHTLEAWDELSQAETGGIDIEDAETTRPPVSKQTLRAWVQYAREEVFPTPSEAAKDMLGEYYVEVRDLNDAYDGDDDGEAAVAATMRTLEAAVRLATSFARLRLSETVEARDAEQAIELSKRVVGMRFDPETGQFDVSMQTSGETTSQKNRRLTILNEVRSVSPDGIHHDDLVKTAVDDHGFNEARVEKTISKLKEDGEIYDPQQNERYHQV